MKKHISTLIKIVVSGLLIYWVLHKLDISQIASHLTNLNFTYIFIAFFLFCIAAFSNSYKWCLLLKAQGIEISQKRVLSHYLVGFFFNNFIIGMGEVKRIYDVSKETSKPQAVLASVFMERWTGITCQVLTAMATLILAYQQIPGLENIFFTTGMILLGLICLFVMAGLVSQIPFLNRFKKLYDWLENFRSVYKTYTSNPPLLLYSMALSLVPPVFLVFINYYLTLGMGNTTGLWYFILFIPTISVYAQIPVTFNGIGVQEFFFVTLFSKIGLSAESAVAISFLSHMMKVGVGFFGAIIYLLRKEKGD